MISAPPYPEQKKTVKQNVSLSTSACPPVVERFVEMLIAERGASSNTISSYQLDLQVLQNFLGALPLEDAAPTDLHAFFKAAAQDKPTTQARRLSSFRQFYQFLIEEDYRKDNPTTLIERPRLTKALPKILTEADINSLLNAAQHWPGPEGLRLEAMLEVMYATGIRVSELLTLPWRPGAWEQPTTDTLVPITILGKGQKERVVPLTPAANAAIHAYIKVRPYFLAKYRRTDSPWLFPSGGQGPNHHLTRQRFYQLLRELALRIGMAPEKVSPHVIRHAFATHLLNHGADLRSVQQFLGHATIGTTQIYTHVATDHLTEVVQTYHPLAKK
jgi:integrase/recombinase XerD